jgi:glycogen(starch) synthase
VKIAYISYEFPPDTGFGGIGTYTYQIAHALAKRGHYIEIFSCSHNEEKLNIYLNDSIMVHRVKADRRLVFSKLIVDVFRQRNEVISFDIIESPEYCAEGLEVRKAFPSIPMVVKLHTPIFLVKKLNNFYTRQPLKKQIKKILGLKTYNKQNDTDYQLVRSADAVCSPSIALKKILKKEWDLNGVEIIPYVFNPSKNYLDLPISDYDSKIITYMGRLDVRKGIKSLVEAIPVILKKHPDVKFRFIGSDGEAPNGGSMKEYMLAVLHKYAHELEFVGYTNHYEIPNLINDTGIFIIPSIWENYPCVCLEAMSAGKAIIASKNGGMREMLEDVKGGILIDPLKPREIANAIIWLLENPKVRMDMGYSNRQKMKTWSVEIIRKVERFYSEIINSKNKANTAGGSK